MQKVIAILFSLVATNVSANAQNLTNTYVNGSAPSANTACTYDSPCSSLTAAIGKTVSGGMVICQSPPAPSFQGVYISRAMTIDCASGPAAVSGAVGFSIGSEALSNVVLINVPSGDVNQTVKLIGFEISVIKNPPSPPSYPNGGIGIQSAGVVILDHVRVTGFNRGIGDFRSAGQSRLYVANSEFSSMIGPGIVAASKGPAVTVLDNVSLLNNGYGLAVASGNNVVVSRSTVSGNATAGIHADGGAQVNVLNSALSHNTVNINAYGTVRLQENAIQFSNTAVQGSGAVSVGANRFLGNASIGVTPALASGAAADVFN